MSQEENQNKAALRSKAETLLGEKAPGASTLSSEEEARLLQELQVHEIELQIQNEELRATQAELIESRDRYSHLFHNAPIGYLVLDEMGMVQEANEAFCRLAGLQVGSVRGKAFSSFLAEPWNGIFIARYKALVKNPREKKIEAQLFSPGGKITWVCLEASLLLDSSGRSLSKPANQLLLMVSDITERTFLMQAVERSKSKLEAALAGMSDAVSISDLQDDFIDFNDAFLTFHGVAEQGERPKNLVDLSGVLDLCFPDGAPAPLDMWPARRALRGESATNMEYVVRRYGEQHIRHGSYSFAPVRDKNAAVIGAVVVSRDITSVKLAEREREALQSQLHHAQKMESIGRLAGGVAHDLNNMLGVIIGNAELAIEEIEFSSSVHSSVQEIMKAANRSADLVRRLLAFARKQTISPRVLNINETVESMLKMLRQLIGEDIELVWNPGAEIRPVKVDPTQIDQILANLCVNARDAIVGVGTVTIETGNVSVDMAYCDAHPEAFPGEYVFVAVSDDGCGMRKEVIDKLFEPFFTTKEVGKGTGLGLATVYGIVKQNSGFIDVRSPEGRGAAFRIHLPVLQTPEAGGQPIRQPGKSHPTETILLVEDEEAVLMLGKKILEQTGYKVLTAQNPAEALILAYNFPDPIHLLITDVVMPGMNGKEFSERLAKLKHGFKRLFMSGYTREVIARNGVLDEGVEFLQKPFSISALADKVREILDL